MIRKAIVALAIGSTLGAPAYADAVIFACQTQSGKVVRFSDLGTSVRYSYGREGYPDLVFIEPKRSVGKACRNNPNGGFFYHGISIKHGGTTYTASKNESVDPIRNYMTVSLDYSLSVTNRSGSKLAEARCVHSIVDNVRSAKVPDVRIGDCE